jgi:hypothetical protein
MSMSAHLNLVPDSGAPPSIRKWLANGFAELPGLVDSARAKLDAARAKLDEVKTKVSDSAEELRKALESR